MTNPTAPAPLTERELLHLDREFSSSQTFPVIDPLLEDSSGGACEEGHRWQPSDWQRVRATIRSRDAQLREVRAERDRSRKHAKRLERDYGLLELRTENADARVLADCTTIADTLLADDRLVHLNFALCRDDNDKWDGEVLFSLFGPSRSIDLWVEDGHEGHTICLVRDSGDRPLALTEHHDCLHQLAAHLDWLCATTAPHSDGPATEEQ